MRNIFCPFCGKQTQIPDNKDFCFCLECGSKIEISLFKPKEEKQEQTHEDKKAVETPPETEEEVSYKDEITSKIEEALFYYQISKEKNEASYTDTDPLYYLKAQDLLYDLSKEYPDDYRIWWEMCKPIDYDYPEKDMKSSISINEDFFGKALDKANLSQKRELVKMHDEYTNRKSASEKIREEEKSKARKQELEDLKKKLEEEQQYKEEKQRLEMEAREKALESQKKRLEEERLLEEKEKQLKLAEQQLKEQKIKNKDEVTLDESDIANLSAKLHLALSQNNFDEIKGKYFHMELPDSTKIIGVFKAISNMLSLSAFRVDDKKNAVFIEQTVAIKIDTAGKVIKYDNRPLQIKAFETPNNLLNINYGEDGKIYVNNYVLIEDADYTNNISRTARKQLISTKIFI